MVRIIFVIIILIIYIQVSLSKAFWAVFIRFASDVKVGGMYLLRIVDKLRDFSTLDDYFKFSRFVIAIMETLFADKLLSFIIILTS